ncbi:MAG: hypothetical protein SF097_18830 [Acidobacteriota bacterium]|nr:hypothetical protein [Acidobacteriota bacterium]
MSGAGDKKPYDTAFKDLADQDPVALLRLVGALPEGATVKPLPREMTAPALFADQPYEVISATEHFVAHLEAQTYYADDVPARVAKYQAIIWINTGLPVRTYVLVLSPNRMPAEVPTEFTVNADGLTLTARFHVVKLWEIDAQWALAMNSESLLPFVSLMKGGQDEFKQSTQGLARVQDQMRKLELALHFFVLGSLRYPAADVLHMIERYGMFPLQQLKDSPGYQFILAQGVEQGIEKGIEEGIEKGRQAIEEVLLGLIEKKFPGLNLNAEIDCVHDIEGLKQLCFNLDQVADAEELRAKVNELATRN